MGIGAFLGASIGTAFGLKNEYLVVTLPVGFLLGLLLGSDADSMETKSGAVGPAVAVSTGVALLSYFAGAAFLRRGFVLVLPLWGGFAAGTRVYNGLRPVRRLGAMGRWFSRCTASAAGALAFVGVLFSAPASLAVAQAEAEGPALQVNAVILSV